MRSLIDHFQCKSLASGPVPWKEWPQPPGDGLAMATYLSPSRADVTALNKALRRHRINTEQGLTTPCQSQWAWPMTGDERTRVVPQALKLDYS